MWYMGGKFRQSKAIDEHLKRNYHGGAYLEPFVGAFGVTEKVLPSLYSMGCREFVLSDKSKPIIDMWTSVMNGWEPPTWVSNEEYDDYKKYKHDSNNIKLPELDVPEIFNCNEWLNIIEMSKKLIVELNIND